MLAAPVFFFTVHAAIGQSAVLEEEATLEQVQQSEFTEIAIEDLPAVVQQAVERDFSGGLIAGAFVANSADGKKFKIVVQTADGEQKELFSDSEGNWINQ